MISNRTGNGTNFTAGIIGGDEAGGGVPSWVWILLAVALLVCIPLAVYFLCCGDEKRKGSKKKKNKRSAREVSTDGNEDSYRARDGPELEMQQPLVQNQGADLFDQLDADHDGVITQAEFGRAMGVPVATTTAPVASYRVAPGVGAPTNLMAPVPGMPAMSVAGAPYQTAMAAPVQSLVGEPVARFAAPVQSMVPGPVQTAAPGRITVSPFGANVQYAAPGMRPYGQ